MDILKEDTIAAIATPFGTGGTGKIRISGPQAYQIGDKILNQLKRKNLKNKNIYSSLWRN